MIKKLNWNENYAEICGPGSVPGAKYMQNDQFFGVLGNPIYAAKEEERAVKAQEAIEEASTIEEAEITAETEQEKMLKEAEVVNAEETAVADEVAGEEPALNKGTPLFAAKAAPGQKVPKQPQPMALTANTKLAPEEGLPTDTELQTSLDKGMSHTDIAKVWGCSRQKITKLVGALESK